MAANLKASAKDLVKRLIDNRLVYYRVARDPNSVMLTFDDGPHPEFTPRVLDLLDAHGAKGVFFPIGERIESAPELIAEIHERGHYLGNHTYSHLNDYQGGKYTLRQYLADIRRAQDLIFSIAGVKTRLFRPPRGEMNLKSLSAPIWAGHRVVFWSLDGGEWASRAHEPGHVIAEYVTESVQPRDIVLLHDDNEKTVEVLESLLPRTTERRYDLQTNALVRH